MILGRVPVLGWYVRLLIRSAQPRRPDAPERTGLERFLYGSTRPRHGWSATDWGFRSLLSAVTLTLVVVYGGWWLLIPGLPVLGWTVARTIGTYREGYVR